MANRGKLTFLTDLQFGSTGKGAVMARLVGEYDYAVRVGAIQAGHTIYYQGKKYPMQSIPCLWIDQNCKMVIGANGMLRRDIFEREIAWLEEAGFNTIGRILIDPAAGIISEGHAERGRERSEKTGRSTTREGVGEATADRAMRLLPIARDTDWCQPYLCDTVALLNNELKAGRRVIIEGTQGAGLCLSTGRRNGNPFYPQCTSREVTPAGMMADCGLNPGIARYADIDTIGVMRTYPIRIAGNSGDIGVELTWEEITKRCGSPEPICEITTVTKKVRRVAEFDMAWTKEVVNYINPTSIVLTFADYINYQDHCVRGWDNLSQATKDFVATLTKETGVPVTMVGTGPDIKDFVEVPEHRTFGATVESASPLVDEYETTSIGIVRKVKHVDPGLAPVYTSRIGEAE